MFRKRRRSKNAALKLLRIFNKNHLLIALPVLFSLIGLILFFSAFGPAGVNPEIEQFTIAETDQLKLDTDPIISELKESGFLKHGWALKFALKLRGAEIVPGAYRISKAMSTWELARVFSNQPSLKWVRIREGMRKEEIAQILGKALNWSEKEIGKWINEYTAKDPLYFEGVYFPDNYLIPINESPKDTAMRLAARFEEKFAPYAKEALAQDIKWDTVLKIASLIQREAAGAHDMALISGILWNRLLTDMKLQIDATLQYARGDVGDGWWAPISPSEKEIDSPYNTYKYSGLPPSPIANPGLSAIRAALNPEKTNCLFYIHDSNRQIHCSRTYAEHVENINTYLK